MAKTVEQKLTDWIMTLLEYHSVNYNRAQLYIVVRGNRLRFRTPQQFLPGDIHVLKVTNQHGNTSTRLTVTYAVNALDRHIALAPLLKKTKRKDKS